MRGGGGEGAPPHRVPSSARASSPLELFFFFAALPLPLHAAVVLFGEGVRRAEPPPPAPAAGEAWPRRWLLPPPQPLLGAGPPPPRRPSPPPPRGQAVAGAVTDWEHSTPARCGGGRGGGVRCRVDGEWWGGGGGRGALLRGLSTTPLATGSPAVSGDAAGAAWRGRGRRRPAGAAGGGALQKAAATAWPLVHRSPNGEGV